MVANLGRITTLAATPSAGPIDGVDSIHTGIIKALEIMGKNRACVAHDGFTQSVVGGFTRYSLVNPHWIKDGSYHSYSGTLTVDQTSDHDSNGTYSRYLWVSLGVSNPASPTLALSIESNIYSSPRIADISSANFIPIALVNIEAGSDRDISTRSMQLFTQDMLTNTISVRLAGQGEKGKLSASSNGLSIDGTTATIVTTPHMSLGNGATNAGELRFLEDTDNGAYYTGFKAPAAVTSNSVYTLPAAFPGSNLVLQSDSSGVLSWVTGGGTITALNNQAANRLVTIGATTTQLDGEANLTFDGSALALTGTQTITGSITVDKDFSGTTTATTKGAYIDFDATGITASGQTATNIGLDLDMNSNAPTMVGTVNNTGIDVTLTGGTSGVQKNVGIQSFVTGADSNYPIIAFGGNSGFGTATPSRLLSLTDTDGGTNAVIPILRLTEFSAGVTPANGLGAGIEFEVSTANGNEEIIATIEAVAQDVSSGAEVGSLSFKTMTGGAAATEVLRLGDTDGNDILFTGNQGHGFVKLTATTCAASTFENKRFVVFMNAGAIAATMPAGIEGRTYNFKNSHAGQVTFTCAGSDNFRRVHSSMGGVNPTQTLDVGQNMTVIYNAADNIWEIMELNNMA